MLTLYQDILGNWHVTEDTRNFLGELHLHDHDIPKVIDALLKRIAQKAAERSLVYEETHE